MRQPYIVCKCVQDDGRACVALLCVTNTVTYYPDTQSIQDIIARSPYGDSVLTHYAIPKFA